jgi:shikimate dehydrogenase
MLVNQAVIGVRHWTGVDADPTVVRRTLVGLFGEPTAR